MIMDRTLSFCLYIAIFLSLISLANAGCWIEDFDEYCNYTIVCEARAGPLELPVCARAAHNPTLLITKSTLEIFTMNFYQSTDCADLVTSIKAVDSHWTVIAPYAFNFFHCTRIDLSNNGIEIINNNSFRASYSLRELNLSMNAIEKLYPSSFQVSDYSWSNHMAVLELSFNMLTTIPNGSLHSLPELKELYLHNNKLAQLTDDTFMNLNNLKVLTLSHNQLKTLDVTLRALRNLKELDISCNGVKYLHQEELLYAKSLEKVIMSNNIIESIDFKAFRYAKNLQIIDLSNNKIKSLLLPFYNNAKLRTLNFSNNSISIIDYASFYNLSTLESIDFSLNKISVLKLGMIKNAVNLQTLNLSSNSLTSLSAGSLKSLQKIAILDLSHNKLENLFIDEFKQINKLKTLVLDYNLLKEIDFVKLVRTVPKLRVISVGSNPIPCQNILDYYKQGITKGVNVTSIDNVADYKFGITCKRVVPVTPVVLVNPGTIGLKLKTDVLICTALMMLLSLVLLIALVRICFCSMRKIRVNGEIELKVMEEQTATLMSRECTSQWTSLL